jgi:hypothetical protein
MDILLLSDVRNRLSTPCKGAVGTRSVPGGGKRAIDRLQHAVEILFELVIGKPKHPDTFSLQETGSRCIMCAAFDGTVLIAVEFDSEFRFSTVEIENVWTDRVLAAKGMTAHLRATKVKPQFLFWLRRIPAKLARARCLRLRSIETRHLISLP